MWKDESNQGFLAITLPLLLGALALHFFHSYKTLFWSLQIEHSYWNDRFFFLLTGLGNAIYLGLFCILIMLLLRKNLQQRSSHLVLSFLLSSVVVVVCKNLIWPEVPRPSMVFGKEFLTLVSGVDVCGWRSFPSGHTTTAFALLSVMATWVGKKYGILLGILALLIGYSRIHLNQHFPLDVAVGGIIGIISNSVALHITRNLIFQKSIESDHSKALA